jgi:uncharacterized membrane protein
VRYSQPDHRILSIKKDSSPNKFNFVLGILGAILVGSGIVLLIAHNWNQLNKLYKTIFAFLPLAIAQAACVYALLRKKENRPGRKAALPFYFLQCPPAYR